MDKYILVILIVVAQLSFSSSWNYNDQDSWSEMYCQKAVAQSPIDVQTASTIPQRSKSLRGSNWNHKFNATITNNGHSVVIEPTTDKFISLYGGGLPGRYIMSQFHFHWDSEHTINGDRKALEAHFVFYNSQFANQSEAVSYANGVAVLAVLYDLSKRGDNQQLQPIVDELDKVESTHHSSRVTFRFLDLVPRDRTRFYRYWGSLTTPDCNDVVVWTIFSETCRVSQNQVDKFASIKDSHGMRLVKNFRKLQPLNCRNVYEVHASERVQ